jgi:nucleoside-triphosphatase
VAGEEVHIGNADPLRVLLEGRPGIGKTTVARWLVALLRDAGVPLGGFVTDEIRVRGRREGFMVEAVSGDCGVLAHVAMPGPPRVGRYGVDLQAFERIALPALVAPKRGGVVVVDELGKMELASAAFREAVSVLWDRDVAVVATVQLHHHPFTDALKARPDVCLLRVTEQGRDALPERLAAKLHPVGAAGRAR